MPPRARLRRRISSWLRGSAASCRLPRRAREGGGAVGGDGLVDGGVVRVEVEGDGPQEGVALRLAEARVAVEDQAGQRHPGGLAAPGDQVLAELDEVAGTRRDAMSPRPIPIRSRPRSLMV